MIEIRDDAPFDLIEKMRIEVFIKEQGFTSEFDDLDKISTHLVLFEDGIAKAYLRFYKEKGNYFIGRVLVLKKYRHKFLSSLLIKRAEEMISSGKIIIHAQYDKVGLYKKLGYKETDIKDYDEGVLHTYLYKVL
ncbi:MAG: GNAT family N-acetyltransferase [Tissierellia bacterium]|nr:GNAT family N-acetyltransferase [Tissierellia bacterium]